MFSPFKRHLLPLIAKVLPSNLIYKSLGTFVPIFMLHRMECPEVGLTGHSPPLLHRALMWLRRRGYQFLTLEQLVLQSRHTGKLPSKAVVFTMDDGFFDQGLIAGPLFSEYDCPVTYFTISDFIDGKIWPWDDQVSYAVNNSALPSITITFQARRIDLNLGSEAGRKKGIRALRATLKSVDNRETYRIVADLFKVLNVERPIEPPPLYQPMSWSDLERLQRMGHAIAPHTCSHRILSRLDDEEARHEIEASRDAIVRNLGSVSPVFAYPTGRAEDFTQRDMRLIEEAGLIAATSTVPGYITNGHRSRDDWFALPRFSMPDEMADFIQYATWIERAKEKSLGLYSKLFGP